MIVSNDAIILEFSDTLQGLTSNLRRDIHIISEDLGLTPARFERSEDTSDAVQKKATSEDVNSPRSAIHRRTFILVLYSYWESIIKESSEAYLSLVKTICTDPSTLCDPLRTLHRLTSLQSDGYLNRTDNLSFASHSILLKDGFKDEVPEFSTKFVAPKSNLNAERFRNICEWLNIDYDHCEIITETRLPGSKPTNKFSNFTYSGLAITECIDRFVGYRNDLAHSALNKPPSVAICSFYRTFIPDLIEAFTEDLENMAIADQWLSKDIYHSN